MFITLEGPDGAGKTTQAARLAERLRPLTVVAVHEPGGTDLGTDVRALLLRRGGRPIDPWAEALLFSACRAQLVAEVIRPALDRGEMVVADRFSDSTLAYQGAGRGLEARRLALLIDLATGGLRPDLTVLLDVPVEIGLGRLQKFGKAAAQGAASQISFFEELRLPESWNRFEDEGDRFQERVRAGYLDLARQEPERWVVIDAAGPIESVSNAIWGAVFSRLAGARPVAQG